MRHAHTHVAYSHTHVLCVSFRLSTLKFDQQSCSHSHCEPGICGAHLKVGNAQFRPQQLSQIVDFESLPLLLLQAPQATGQKVCRASVTCCSSKLLIDLCLYLCNMLMPRRGRRRAGPTAVKVLSRARNARGAILLCYVGVLCVCCMSVCAVCMCALCVCVSVVRAEGRQSDEIREQITKTKTQRHVN